MSRFVRNIDFSSLGLKDLLEARDHYHVHLANLEHVVGTAIGRYRIRRGDPNFNDPESHEDPGDLGPRTLSNSGVKPWSWPCVLVLVDQWQTREFILQNAANLVPPRLYLPDGRVVPTCVIHALRKPEPPPPLTATRFPSGLIGGGYPLLTEAQGMQRIGSIGCLVTDGYYTDEPELRAFCRSRGLAGYKIPRRILFTDTLRRAPNGKADDRISRQKAPRL